MKNLEDIRKEYKAKFDLLSVNQIGLIGYYLKLHNDKIFIQARSRFGLNEYHKRIKEILMEVK
tara:strand:- start:82 stop:270 length:189 start_codon:yes stop_codon:yes gene_type:complete